MGKVGSTLMCPIMWKLPVTKQLTQSKIRRLGFGLSEGWYSGLLLTHLSSCHRCSSLSRCPKLTSKSLSLVSSKFPFIASMKPRRSILPRGAMVCAKSTSYEPPISDHGAFSAAKNVVREEGSSLIELILRSSFRFNLVGVRL